MIREEIENKTREIVADLLDIDEETIHDKSDFVNDLQADSLDAVEMVMSVEDKFDISITDVEAEQAVSFKLLVDLVERKINA